MKDSYHHGNLRNALIEAGLKIINESGEDALSLRKVAAACGVSHAAPYAHFADKESLIEAIKQKVTDDFTEELERSVNAPGVTNTEEAILSMGEAYIMFFRNKPDYFNFLFGKQKIQVHTDMTREYEDDYPPFILFRGLIKKYFEENHMELSPEQQEIVLLQTWGVVQGLSSLASMDGVEVKTPWEVLAKECIKGGE